MPLSNDLTHLLMSHSCPNCRLRLQTTCGWFRALSQQDVCPACKASGIWLQ
jgi:predicted RNA-binding Zn-ribbon protein involved in translation (DUF1610 family)